MKNEIVFKESGYYKKNIKFFSNNLKKILKQNKINFKNSTILDFGCGNCLLHKYLKFKKIFLYDLEHSYYNNNYLKKTKTFKTVKEIKNFKGKFDIILLNSVIQYIKPDDLKKILIILSKKINKHGLIILSDIPGVRDVISNEEGFIVEPLDPDAISEALEKIWNGPEMAKQMGKKGRERVVKLFSWEKVSKDVEKIFLEVTSK